MVSVKRQRGALLVVILSLVVLAGTALFVGRFKSAAIAGSGREAVTARSLAQAKGALIAWAVTASSLAGGRTAPGLLPFPDRNRDGNYDGKGDCVTFGLNDSHLLGRLPWAGDARPCPQIGLHIDILDASGEHLWYAVSRNLVTRGRGGPINSDSGEPGRMAHPWIVVRDADGRVITEPGTGMPLPIAAIIIAPGAALEGKDRSGAAPAPENYLDSITIGATTYDNSDADGCPDALTPPCSVPSLGEEFIVHRGAHGVGNFNDRLVYITVDELMQKVEMRVLGQAAIALNRYRSANGVYPWLANFTDPESASFKSGLFRAGLLALHLPDEIFSTGFGGSWNFIDATPTTVTWHSGDAALTPPLADLQAGKIQVTSSNGRCRWTDRTRADCMGSRIIPEYFRADLGIAVTRIVEYFFSVLDKTPEVTPPVSADVRRRALSISGSLLPTARLSSPEHPSLWPEVSWSIRITDDDGVNRGRREIRIDSDTVGAITLTGIRFDLSIIYDDIDDARDELPEWFVENKWHHFIYAAFSSDAVAGGDGDCRTPANTCLTLTVDGKVVRSDVRALLVSAGFEWPHQDRTIGDCDGDGVGDDFLCAYFDGDNSDKSTVPQSDIYARDRYSADFNDQVRIIEPLPP